MTTQSERESPPASSRPRHPGWDLVAAADQTDPVEGSVDIGAATQLPTA